jgi:hypothetical protein
MRKKLVVGWVVCALAATHAAFAAGSFVPDFKLKPDDYTVLMAVDAKLSDGLIPFQAGAHGKFFIQGWQRPEQMASWTVTATERADYAVNVLVRQKSRAALRLELAAAGKTLAAPIAPDARHWQRVKIAGLLPLGKGAHEISLRLLPTTGTGAFDAQVHAVEFVRPAVRDALHDNALRVRADPTWFQQARYGMMVHWTKESMPLHGAPKPYDQAVADFDAEAFADQMRQTGAGFVVFTTAHALQYFPAPLAALEKVLPGRTTKRDLVADLAAALGRRGMKLFIYYHLGAINDTAWLKASGFWETDTTGFFNNWQAIVSEAGERYGDKLAGWWFDDGAVTYYYRSAPWEKLNRAAKAGHPQRLVGFNPWELNSPTEFQDFFCGEGFQEPQGFNRLLTPQGNGRYPSGTHEGLQASACLIVERDWVHARRDTPLAGPRWNPTQLAGLIHGFIAHNNVPVFNLEITQDGRLSPESLALFQTAVASLPPTKPKIP